MPTRPLDRLLYAQGGDCFFCERSLPKEDASVEHLVASANGGSNGDDNCVVCCKALNALLGRMSLKEKIKVLLKQKGTFKCPNGAQDRPTDSLELVVSNLQRRGAGRPKTVSKLLSTIRSLFQKGIDEDQLAALLRQLQDTGFISIDGTKVVYGK